MKSETLDFADRWICDAFAESLIPAGHLTRVVNMSDCMEMIRKARKHNVPATPTSLIVRAAALALVKNPNLHRMIIGSRRYIYDRVDICLSVAGQSVTAPTMVICDAGNKTWMDIAEEIWVRADQVREKETVHLNRLRRWGWVLPLSGGRRAFIRWMRSLPSFRHATVGTFQVSMLRGVDAFAAFQFGTAGILTAGEVRERTVIIDHTPVARPTIILGCSFNHKVWDGKAAAQFLTSAAAILSENEVLETELATRFDTTELGLTA